MAQTTYVWHGEGLVCAFWEQRKIHRACICRGTKDFSHFCPLKCRSSNLFLAVLYPRRCPNSCKYACILATGIWEALQMSSPAAWYLFSTRTLWFALIIVLPLASEGTIYRTSSKFACWTGFHTRFEEKNNFLLFAWRSPVAIAFGILNRQVEFPHSKMLEMGCESEHVGKL